MGVNGEVLSVEDARRRFGATQALDGASAALRAGEFVGLLGPNGAGKTTLIRAVVGRVRLDSGRISLLGQALDGSAAARDARRQLGLVPQEYALYPLLTARENLEVFGKLHGVEGDTLRRRVDEALAWTGLADRAREPVRNFSGGMKRRLNIACGVLHEPKVVLLDEPTVGVDPQSRERIWQMLGQLRERGATLLLTTHQLDEAQRLCERIVIIDHGRTIAAGTFEELVQRTIGPRRRVTFVLSGAPPAALDGAFERDGSALRSHVADVAAELPPLLATLQKASCRVEDVQIEAPTLHAVFIHLTGRELRE